MIRFLILVLVLFVSGSVQAEIPENLLSGACIGHGVASQETDGAVRVEDAVLCDQMFAKALFLEVTIADLGFEKEIFIYDGAESFEFERNVRVVISDESLQSRDGAAVYLGKTDDGRDRFVIRLASAGRTLSAPVSIFVKMNGSQFETRDVRLN